MIDKLMVVAHPDDESIFGGATLLSEQGWKVICLTNAGDKVRSKEFQRAMKLAGATYEIWDYPDIYRGSFDVKLVSRDLRKVISKQSWNRIVTHNLCGEYGHSQHKSLSKIVHDQELENLHVFGKGDDVIPFHLLRKKLDLLANYQSQMFLFKQLWPYILNEKIVPYTNSPCFIDGELK